ncbi:alpha/beta hydrolase [Paraburkholderia sp. J10-1]|uniref:alpha/beta fold hydrolase n=1 Tax=Paraburkholderia sp. J10-1 TaxID=2805430 RepID=UPI002AB5F7A6|nr:alpha/beta hydrolase [Paraburkholderia sp. J10-1]
MTKLIRRVVKTSHGDIALEESVQEGLPVLLIHGNSSCRGVFRHQLDGPLAARHRLIAFDLPGHGESSNAPDPNRTYLRGGLADAAVELLGELGIDEAVVLGWSLGGHIGIDMIARFPGLKGLMISGTPPVGRDTMAQGFTGLPQAGAASREHLSGAEIDAFVQGIFGDSAEPFLRDAVARADGRMRKRLFEGLRAGLNADQREIVETSVIPLAVVNGGADRIVNLDYFDSVSYGNLWGGQCVRLPGLGHAPFWQSPETFDPVLTRFLADIEANRAAG